MRSITRRSSRSREVARLGGRQVLVEDHQIDVALEGADHELVEAPGAEQQLRIDARPVLGEDRDHLDARRARQLLELFELHLDVERPTPGGDGDQDRALGGSDLAGSRLAGELFLARSDEGAEVEVEQRRRRRLEVLDRGIVGVGGTQRRGVGQAGEPIGQRRDRDHRIESQEREVGEIVAGERLGAQMGVDAAQSAQAPAPGAHPAPIRQLDRARVAHHHVGDGAGPIDQHADLAPGLAGQLGEVPREFLGDQAIGRNLPPEEAFELSDLAGLQPMGVSEDADGLALPSAVG